MSLISGSLSSLFSTNKKSGVVCLFGLRTFLSKRTIDAANFGVSFTTTPSFIRVAPTIELYSRIENWSFWVAARTPGEFSKSFCRSRWPWCCLSFIIIKNGGLEGELHPLFTMRQLNPCTTIS